MIWQRCRKPPYRTSAGGRLSSDRETAMNSYLPRRYAAGCAPPATHFGEAPSNDRSNQFQIDCIRTHCEQHFTLLITQLMGKNAGLPVPIQYIDRVLRRCLAPNHAGGDEKERFAQLFRALQCWFARAGSAFAVSGTRSTAVGSSSARPVHSRRRGYASSQSRGVWSLPVMVFTKSSAASPPTKSRLLKVCASITGKSVFTG